MLFGYPVAATSNNWLHECLCEAVVNVHGIVDANKRYPKWPQIIPDRFRARLRRRTGLRDRLRAYHRALKNLEKDDRDEILTAIEAENRIPDLLTGACECATIDELPKVIRIPAADLFGFGFDLLTDLEVRDAHYSAIYNAAPEHVCPFCGTEYFDAPSAPREALDHYLVKDTYPFAATNLRNLVPMGNKCNSGHKLDADLLHEKNGTRREAIDPYNHTTVRVFLDGSDPFHGTEEHTPNWDIRFDPATPAVATWDEVFSVSTRYRRDHLDPSYSDWLRHFGRWARDAGLNADIDQELVNGLQRYEDLWQHSGIPDRAFLKAAVFRMLRIQCERGHARLKALLRDVLRMG